MNNYFLCLGNVKEVPFLKVLFIDLLFKNKHSNPISIKGTNMDKFDILGNKEKRYKTMMVARDVMSQISIQAFDLKSGKMFVENNTGSVVFKRRQLKDNLYSIKGKLEIGTRNGMLYI